MLQIRKTISLFVKLYTKKIIRVLNIITLLNNIFSVATCCMACCGHGTGRRRWRCVRQHEHHKHYVSINNINIEYI